HHAVARLDPHLLRIAFTQALEEALAGPLGQGRIVQARAGGGGASLDPGACSGLRVDVPGTGPRHSPFLADDARGARGRKTICSAVGGDPGGGQTPLFADDRSPNRQAGLPVDDAGSPGGGKPTFLANDACRTRGRQASLFANDGRTRRPWTPLLTDDSHCRGRQPTFLTD